MTIVRIAHAEPRPGKLEHGGFQTLGWLVVLADDAGHRAVPVWLPGEPGSDDLAELIEVAARPDEEIRTADAPEELTARLLHAAGAGVTGVDIDVTGADTDELSPQGAVARIGLSGHKGSREGPVPLPEPAAALAVLRLGRRQRYEPRNLAFADGLDGWLLGGSFTQHASDSHWQDYSSGADDGIAVLSATVPRPAGFAFLGQEMFADDYRGDPVTVRGEFRARGTAPGRAGLFLRVVSEAAAQNGQAKKYRRR